MLEMFVTKYTSMAKFQFASTYDSKEISKSVTSLCSNVFDDVTDFEICGIHKNTKIYISQKGDIIFSSNKKFINWATLWQKILLQRS